ncbi:mannosyl-glycoprotein endo-beta-N-acetylglucosaminidase [[Clostridium] sordellii]|uniref:Ig-like domain-containing protein n=1 Tax=Paraclostridium sordellii TaxID=1505 RepID=UPI0005DD4EAB|nr:glucosaminidase domain-containing protein [Paeniclostridium sordellii]CEQ10471.1 mannosyl-glycoprotein endo-beta-N-acetylglucosaminidase [[Clostridium] sordellii] [Paeniclostridium sordellii]
MRKRTKSIAYVYAVSIFLESISIPYTIYANENNNTGIVQSNNNIESGNIMKKEKEDEDTLDKNIENKKTELNETIEKNIENYSIKNNDVIQNDKNRSNLESKVWIDEPRTVINNEDIKVRGWALNNSGVKEVKIYVDGKYKGNAEIGKERLDVNTAYPGYPGGENSGYEMTIKKDEMSPGKHELKVESIGNDGSTKIEITGIEIIKPENRLWIDEPRMMINNEDIKVRGWALNNSGVKEVKIYVDGKYKGNAEIGKERLDVNTAYPGYPGGENSGYEMTIKKDEMSPGKHELKVESIGNDGSTKIEVSAINMIKPEPKAYIDEPHGSITINDKLLKVRGWTLNSSGVKEVKIYVDGKYKGNADIGLDRPDVSSVYPGYPGGGKSGFLFSLDTMNLGFGNHEIKVESIGNDGSNNVVSTLIEDFKIIEYKDWTYSFDTQVSKQIEKNSDMKFDSNGRYVKATPEEIRYYMDYKNFNNQKDMYQFLRLDVYKDVISIEKVNNRLSKILKDPINNPLFNQGQAFVNAAKEYDIDPIYLIAHTCLETGYGSSKLAKGYDVVLDDDGRAMFYEKVIDGKTYKFVKIKDESTPKDAKTVKVYNFFGIGAIDKAATEGGVTTAYKNGWTTPEKGIKGAAKWISNGYIHNYKYNQNTLYYMRWYYDTQNGNWHQYATDIGWSRKISSLMYNLSDLYNPSTASMIYDLPRYSESKLLNMIKSIFN